MVRHKSSKLKSGTMKNQGWTTAAESSRSADSLEMHAHAAIAGTVLHGNNAAN